MTATIKPDKILKELANLWIETAAPSESGESSGVLRACAMTMVVIVDETEDTQSIAENIKHKLVGIRITRIVIMWARWIFCKISMGTRSEYPFAVPERID